MAFVAQLRHVDFCIESLHQIRLERQRDPTLSWKQAQKLAAQLARNTMLTERNQKAA
jgi:hypothetical protein